MSKSIILQQKKSDGTSEYYYPITKAENVQFNDGDTVITKIEDIYSKLQHIPADNVTFNDGDTLENKIKKIMPDIDSMPNITMSDWDVIDLMLYPDRYTDILYNYIDDIYFHITSTGSAFGDQLNFIGKWTYYGYGDMYLTTLFYNQDILIIFAFDVSTNQVRTIYNSHEPKCQAVTGSKTSGNTTSTTINIGIPIKQIRIFVFWGDELFTIYEWMDSLSLNEAIMYHPDRYEFIPNADTYGFHISSDKKEITVEVADGVKLIYIALGELR